MRNATLLGARLLLGSYMGIHASQKLFGKFHGLGLEGMSTVFESGGLAPGKTMVSAAAAAEIAGGVLIATGFADPAGPLAVAGAMSVAAAFSRKGSLTAAPGSVEVPVSYLALALTLAASGPGKYRIGPSLPGKLTALGVIGGAAAAGAIIATMVTSKPVPAEPESVPDADTEPAADS